MKSYGIGVVLTFMWILPLLAQVHVDTTFKGSTEIAAHLLRLRAPSPNVRPSDLELRLDINFDLDSDLLRPDAKAQLDTLARVLKMDGFVKTRIELAGHTCDIGSQQYNLDLSQRRVRYAVEYLVGKAGITADRISYRAYGEELPLIAGAKSEQERRVNRRVVVYLPENRTALEKMLREMPMAQGFRWAVFRYDQSGKATLVSYDGSSVLHSGDQYRVYMRPSRSKYIYLYQQDSRGNAAWIFPRTDLGLSNPMHAGEYFLPSRTKVFTLDSTTGTETLHLVVSDDPVPELEKLTDQNNLQKLAEGFSQTVIVKGLYEVRQAIIPEEGNANIRSQTVVVGAPNQRTQQKEYRIDADPAIGQDILTVMAQHREFYMAMTFGHE